MAHLKREQLAAVGVHYIYYPLEYMLEAQRKAGFQTIELRGQAPHYLAHYMGFQDPAEMRKKAEDHGLKIGCFAPECTAYQFTLCGADSGFHDRSMAYFKRALEACEGLGTDKLLLNCYGGTFDEEYDRVYARAVRGLRELAPVAADHGVTIAVETLCPAESRVVTTLPELQRLLRDVTHPNVKAALDTAAMGAAGETPRQWFETLGNDIVHTHFVDGRPDGHLVWGDGLFPLEAYLEVLNEFGYAGLLSQELTDGRYFDDPAAADARNFAAFEPYFTD